MSTDDFPDAVMRAGYRAQADALRPKSEGVHAMKSHLVLTYRWDWPAGAIPTPTHSTASDGSYLLWIMPFILVWSIDEES